MGTALMIIGVLIGVILMLFGIVIQSLSARKEMILRVVLLVLGVATIVISIYGGGNFKSSYPIESVTPYWSEHNEVLYEVKCSLKGDAYMIAIMTEEQFKSFKDGKVIKLSLYDEEEIMIKRVKEF